MGAENQATAEAGVEGRARGLAVLLHAAGAGPRALTKLASRLETLVGRTHIPFLPGTVAQPSDPPLSRQVEIARAALANSAGEPRILFGHSFGGLVALLAMLEGAEVEAAILYEPIVIACLDSSDEGDVVARAWDRALIDFLAERTEANQPEPGVARFVEAYNEVAWESLPEAPRHAMVAGAPDMVALTQSVHHHPIDRARVRELGVPILVLHGDRSPELAQRMANRLHALLPDAELAKVDGAGHMGPSLESNRVFRSIASFLRDRL